MSMVKVATAEKYCSEPGTETLHSTTKLRHAPTVVDNYINCLKRRGVYTNPITVVLPLNQPVSVCSSKRRSRISPSFKGPVRDRARVQVSLNNANHDPRPLVGFAAWV